MKPNVIFTMASEVQFLTVQSILTSKENLTSDNLGFAAGKLSLDNEYDRVIVSYADNYAVVELDGKFGYINEDGEEVISLKYEAATLFDGDIAAVGGNGVGSSGG